MKKPTYSASWGIKFFGYLRAVARKYLRKIHQTRVIQNKSSGRAAKFPARVDALHIDRRYVNYKAILCGCQNKLPCPGELWDVSLPDFEKKFLSATSCQTTFVLFDMSGSEVNFNHERRVNLKRKGVYLCL